MLCEILFKVVGVTIGIEMYLRGTLSNRLRRQWRRTQRIFVGCQFDNIGNAELALDLFDRFTSLIGLNRVNAGFRF